MFFVRVLFYLVGSIMFVCLLLCAGKLFVGCLICLSCFACGCVLVWFGGWFALSGLYDWHNCCGRGRGVFFLCVLYCLFVV